MTKLTRVQAETRCQQIINLRDCGMTFREIGRIVGLCDSRASQIYHARKRRDRERFRQNFIRRKRHIKRQLRGRDQE